MGIDNAASFNERLAKANNERVQKIRQFAERNGLERKTYKDGDKTMWFINDRGKTDLLPELRERILNKQRQLGAQVKGNDCYIISDGAVEDGTMNGALHSTEGTSEFATYDNHAVNYLQLPDNRILAVDFTATHTVDRGIGNFDTLALAADNMETLINRLNQLYGGDWKIET